MTSPTTPSGLLSEMSRRTFLAGVSAAAIATPVIGAARSERTFAASATGKTGPLSVGYVDHSESWPDLGGAPGESPSVLELGRSVPAAAATTGDSRFVGQLARITVHGPYPGSLPAGQLDLDAAFLAVSSIDPPVYYAWTDRSGGGAARSAPVSFGVGVPSTNPCLSLSIRLLPQGGTPTTRTATFGVGRGKTIAKLRRGAYLLAVDAGTWDSPRSLPALGSSDWAALSSLVITVEF